MSVSLVMTRDELAATPPERRFYECQQCKTQGTGPGLYRLVSVGLIGFVMCKKCLERDKK